MRTFRVLHRPWLLALAVVGAALLQVAAPATAQTILQNGWEDGTLQGWTPRGGSVVLTNTTEAPKTGTHSLKTTGRTNGWNGPSLDIFSLITPGTFYQFTISARLVAGEPATQLIMTVQRTTGTTTTYERVAATSATGATDSAWVTLQGVYNITAPASALLLYIESSSATASFYVDDFSISVVPVVGCPEPPDLTGIQTDFETGTTQGWGPRGGVTVSATSADSHTGAYSLLTTGRTAAWQGPSINVAGKMCTGSRYNINVWVKLAPGQPDTQIRVSLERRLGSTTTYHTVIGNTTVTASDWVRLRTTYTFTLAYTSLSLYVESASGTPSFYIDDFYLTYVPPAIAERNIASVCETLAPFFPVGAAVWQGDLTGEHAFLLSKHFNSLTSENDMKWQTIEPTEGNFSFTAADAQVAFAKAHNMTVRGHVLIWHSQTPGWVFNDAGGNPMTPTAENKTLLLQRLENHIRGVASHYANDVFAWDVVNEVIDPAEADGFRRSPWFNITGTDFIDRAFQVAHESAPGAKLYISDYSTTDPLKRSFLLNLVWDLKNRGIPIDGVAHQMHNNIEWPSAEAILETINQFSALGLDNQVTELDMSIYSGNFSQPFTAYEDIPADRFVRQAYKYRDFFQAFRYLSNKISSVTFWGQADDHTWLTSGSRVNAPLLFDISLIHKPAYTALISPSDLPYAGSTAVFSGAFVVRPFGEPGTRRVAVAQFSLVNDWPSGTLMFNYNDRATKVRFKATNVITYSVSDASPSRVDLTIVGENAGVPGYILTGYAIDGGPEGSGLDVVSITIRTPTGVVIYSGEGPVSEGDVVIKR